MSILNLFLIKLNDILNNISCKTILDKHFKHISCFISIIKHHQGKYMLFYILEINFHIVHYI